MLYSLQRLWRRLSDGARMLIMLWIDIIAMLLVKRVLMEAQAVWRAKR